MNLKQIVAAAILLFPVVASSVIAKPAMAESFVRYGDYGDRDFNRTVVVIGSNEGYREGHFHHRRLWTPGHWEINRFGYRYWVPGCYQYRYF